MKKAILALEDGFVLEGAHFGFNGEAFGEVVFNTCLSGYQEILTDPSYAGQMVTMTYPHIGNYGVNRIDVESSRPWAEGLIIRELSPVVSNWRAETSLEQYLKKNKVIGIHQVDTRKLVKHLRDFGAQRGVISSVDPDTKRLVEKAKASQSIVGIDLVKKVTCEKPYEYHETISGEFSWPGATTVSKKYSVVCVDCGIKRNILRKLNQHGFKVQVVPAATTADEILKMSPDAVFYSNGPGDPEPLGYIYSEMKKLFGKRPIFGICLGHLMFGLAMGGKTFKLKFGHRGGNHPVKDMMTGRVEITSQNHGFCVDINSLSPDDVEITHINLNDKTLEGIRHRKYPVFSVQYHPENSPGPHDSDYLFTRFYNMIDKGIW